MELPHDMQVEMKKLIDGYGDGTCCAHTIRNRLPDELRECVRDGGICGTPMFKHPFYVTPFFRGSSMEIKHALTAIERRTAVVNDLLPFGDLSGIVFTHERPYRCDALMKYAAPCLAALGSKRKIAKVFGVALGGAWRDSENIWENRVVWEHLWHYAEKLGALTYTMSDKSRMKLRRLFSDGEIEVYRGASSKNRVGMSWTVSKERAVWFAERFSVMSMGRGNVYSLMVRREDALAFFNERGEDEIVIRLTSVRDKKPKKI